MTARGQELRSEHPSGLRTVLDLDGAIGRADLAFVQLLHGVRTGEAAFPQAAVDTQLAKLADTPGSLCPPLYAGTGAVTRNPRKSSDERRVFLRRAAAGQDRRRSAGRCQNFPYRLGSQSVRDRGTPTTR